MRENSRYSRVTDEVLARLVGIVGEKNVLTGDDRYDYSRDETLVVKPVFPEVVVRPEATGSVAKILKLANRMCIPVTPRGGGTGLSGGAVPIYGGIVLSLERMNRILEIDRENFVAVVEAGVVLSDLYQAVEASGLYYPIYPGEKSATLGGNAATNAGGMRAVKYGVTRNSVVGLEAVLPGGEVIQTGGKFVKCSTGYDLTQLLVGSEGTLAVITRVILRLVPPPGKREILFIPFHHLSDAIRSVPDILREGILPVGLEFMERDIIKMVEEYTGQEVPFHDYEAFLMMIVEANSEDEVYRIATHIGELCLRNGAVDVFSPGSLRAGQHLLEVREKFYSVIKHFGTLDLVDVVVPRSKIAEFIEKAKKIASGYGIPLVAYGHAGDGNIHLHPMGRDEAGYEAKAKEMMVKIYKLGVSLGGTISGEHGLGMAKMGYLPMVAGKPEVELMKRIKRAFDPKNIMNPGKVLDMEELQV